MVAWFAAPLAASMLHASLPRHAWKNELVGALWGGRGVFDGGGVKAGEGGLAAVGYMSCALFQERLGLGYGVWLRSGPVCRGWGCRSMIN